MIVYRHLKPNGETFYIGIGKLKRRPYSKANRNQWWHNIVNKYGYEVQVLKSDLTLEDACELEQMLIAYYGRKDLGLGPLVNLTDGGEGVLGLKGNIGNTGKKHSEETKKRISNAKLGSIPYNKGIPMTQAQKDKLKGPRNIIGWNRGIRRTKEQIDNQRKKVKGGNNVNAKLVLNTDTGIFYDCVDDAAASLNINHRTLITYLSGHRKNKTSMMYV